MAQTRDSINIRIGSEFSAKGVREAIKAAQDLKAAYAAVAKAQASGGGTSRAAVEAAKLAAAQAKIAEAASRAGVAVDKSAISSQRLAVAQQQAAAAAARASAEQGKIAIVAANTELAQTRAAAAAVRLQQAQARAASGGGGLSTTLRGLGSEAAGAAKNFLLLGGAGAVVTTALGSIASAANEGRALVATIESTRGAIDAQLKGVRDTAQIYAEGATYARNFKLTQAELNGTLQATAPLFRITDASATDLFTTLGRLQVLAPEKPIDEAARALRELASGDTTSIKELFNISAKDANKMKEEIAGGADAVKVLSTYLDGAGIGMDALKAKTEGASGAAKDLAIAGESLSIALGRIAASDPGVGITRYAATAANAFAGALGNADALSLSYQQLNGLSADAFDWLNKVSAALQGQKPPAEQAAEATLYAASAYEANAEAARLAADGAMIVAQETRISGAASAVDAQEKEYQAIQTKIAEQAALDAANAFLELNPNMDASSAASAAMASGLSPAIAKLAELILKTREARNELAALNSMSGIGAAMGGVNLIRANIAAQVPRTGAVGGAAGTTGATKSSTGGSSAPLGGVAGSGGAGQYVPATTRGPAPKPPAPPKGRAGGGGGSAKGGGGGGGGAARANEAAQSAARLTQIESQLGERLVSIDQQYQDRIAAIDAATAEKRAQVMQDLSEQIAKDATSIDFSNTLDDFDRFQSDMTDEERAELEAREAAQAAYQQRVSEAAAQTAQDAAAVDADYAREAYEARKQAAQRQQEIDEAAAKARIESDGKSQEEIAAVAAAAAQKSQAQLDADLAAARNAAEARTQAVADEKSQAAQAAVDARNAAVQGAQESAEAVKAGAQVGSDAVVAGYNRQMEAIARAKRAAEEYAKATKSLPAPPVVSTTGEPGPVSNGNPPGNTLRGPGAVQGLVAGKGQQQQGAAPPTGGGGGGGVSALQKLLDDALALIIWLDGQAKRNEWNRANTLPQFIGRLKLAIDSINSLIDISKLSNTPTSPIDPKAVQAMVDDMALAIQILGDKASKQLDSAAHRIMVMANAAQIVAGLLGQMAEFRKAAFNEDGKLASPIPADYIKAMVDETIYALNLFNQGFQKANYGAAFRDGFQQFSDNASAAFDLINGMADLSRNLQEPVPPIPAGVLERLADMTMQAVKVLQDRLIPLAEKDQQKIAAYVEAAKGAVELLSSAGSLDANLKDVDGTVFWSTLNNLADTARDALAVIDARLLPYTDEEVAKLKRWTESAGAAIDVLSSAASFMTDMKDLKADGFVPLDLLRRLATLSNDALAIVQAMLPTTEVQAEKLQRWRDGVGASVDALAAAASLYAAVKDIPAGGLSIDLLLQFAEDARKAVLVVDATLIPLEEKAAGYFERWGSVVQASNEALAGTLALRTSAVEAAGAPSLTAAQLKTIATDTTRIVQAIEGTLIPITEEQASAYTNWGTAVEASVGAASAVFGLNGNMFADYVRPDDAQLRMIVDDGERVVDFISEAAKMYDTAGLEAAQALSGALSATYDALDKGLVLIDRINHTDMALDATRLTGLQTSALQILDVTEALAARAVTIPAGNLAALNAASSAMMNYGEAMVAMNAVPLNVPAFGGLGSGGGGGGVVNLTQNIYQQPGQDMNAFARQVVQMTKDSFSQDVRTRR